MCPDIMNEFFIDRQVIFPESVDISRHLDTDTYLVVFGSKNSGRWLSLCRREILDLGRAGILLNALHACRHASPGIIELTGTNDLVIRRLQGKVVLAILGNFALIAIRIRTILLH